MARLRFWGLKTDATVDLTVAQGASTASSSLTGGGQAAKTPMTLSLAASRITGTAPAGIQFSATATSPASRVDIPFHDIEYVWSFDDPGSYRYLDNAPLWGTGRNVAYGPTVSHVFSAPGAYTVTCTAHDGENPPRSETLEIVVVGASSVFPGNSTAVVSLSGNFAGAPPGASLHTSVAAAKAALAGRQNQRLLLRRGETHTVGFKIDEATGAGKRILIGAFGTGDNPLIDKSALAGFGIQFNVMDGVAEELMIRDIDFLGSYDCTSATPDISGGEGLVSFKNREAPFSAHKTVWGCHIKNSASQAIDASTNDAANPMENIFIGDCWLDGWHFYGMLLADAGTIGWCGVKAIMPQGTRNAPNKGLFAGQDWADHGPIRVSRPTGPTTFHNCDLTSFADWSSLGSETEPTRYSLNGAIRWNSGVGDGTADQQLVVDRMRTEGSLLEVINETFTSKRRNVYALVDRYYGVSSNHQHRPLGHAGTTWRNCVLVVPNTPPGFSTGLQNGSILKNTSEDWSSGLSDSNARRMEVYSCALIDLRNDKNSKRRDGSGSPRSFDFPDIDVTDNYVGNNLGYAPNLTDGYTSHTPVDTTSGSWTPLYDGEWWAAQPRDATRGYNAETVSTFKPLTGSSAIGGATGKVSLLDFDGNLRSKVLEGLKRATASVGPYELELES